MSTSIPYYDDRQFAREVENAAGPTLTLVDFSAEARCAPCRMLTPVLDKLQEEYGARVKIVKLDVDRQPELAGKYRIRGIPTLKLLRGGEVLDSSVGVLSYSKLQAFVEEHLAAVAG